MKPNEVTVSRTFLASVGQDENQMQSSFTMGVAKDDERLTFKWMLLLPIGPG